MMNVEFLWQNMIILGILGIIYHLIFRWQNKFLLNRFYLLMSLLLSIIIPLTRIDAWAYGVYIDNPFPAASSAIIVNDFSSINQSQILWYSYIYWTITAILICLFLFKLGKLIFQILNQNDFIKSEGQKIVIQPSLEEPYSFFGYIFLNDLSEDIILQHETSHAKNLHSIDRIFIEVVKCFLWFNPFIYLYKLYIVENHEFTADQYAISKQKMKKSEFSQFLLKNKISYETNLNYTNQFFSIIKNRIIMLSSNSKSYSLSYLLILPLFMILFSAFSLKEYPVYKTQLDLGNVDTIPRLQEVVDTIITFDPMTYTEEVKYVKTKDIYGYLDNLTFSGKKVMVTDTIFVFDTDTRTETKRIQQTKLPIEIYKILDEISPSQMDEIYKLYGSSIILDDSLK